MLGGVPGEPRAPGTSGAAAPGLAHTRQLPAALLPPAEEPGLTSRPAPGGIPRGCAGWGSTILEGLALRHPAL